MRIYHAALGLGAELVRRVRRPEPSLSRGVVASGKHFAWAAGRAGELIGEVPEAVPAVLEWQVVRQETFEGRMDILLQLPCPA